MLTRNGVKPISLSMSLLPIISIPDPVLKHVSEPVNQVDKKILLFLDDMLETMYEAPGIGLAAIQVGEPLRAITMDVSPTPEEGEEPERNPLFLINPEIVWRSDEFSTYEEGCLSIPDYYADVDRPSSCRVEFIDRDGKQQSLEADGLLSVCIQHEVDHLNGILFIDYISKLKREMVIKKFTKMAKQNGTKFIG